MITINGLTKRQHQIMDLLWSCSSIDQVELLIAAMPTEQDRNDAQGLVVIATVETLEQELGLDAYEDIAKAAIARAMR